MSRGLAAAREPDAAVPPAVVRRRPRPRAPRLRLLGSPVADPRARAVGRGAFVTVVAALVLGGMALLLVLNTTLAQGAFDLQQLRAQYDLLQVKEQSLAQGVAAAQSPEALKSQAVRLGMVPVQVPAFLRLADGKVLGQPTPAKARVARAARAPKPAAGTGGTDAASPSGGSPVVAPQSDGAEAAEGAAAQDGRRARGTGNTRPPGDAAVAAPEGAEEQAAPTGTGAGRG